MNQERKRNWLLPAVVVAVLAFVFLYFVTDGFGMNNDTIHIDGVGNNDTRSDLDSDKDGISDADEISAGTNEFDSSDPGTDDSAPTATPAATAKPVANNGPCRLIPNGPWSEVDQAETQGIEVGAAGTEHTDFYTRDDKGNTQAVSYIVPPMPTHVIWHGFGNQWEQPLGPECANYDWEADTIGYAEGNSSKDGRLDEGHSGLVIDLRESPPVLVANAVDMCPDAVRTLLSRQADAMDNGLDVDAIVDQVDSCGGSNSSGTSNNSSNSSSSSSSNCGDGVRGTDHSSVSEENWSPVGDPSTYRSVVAYSNWPGADQQHQWKVFLKPGDPGKIAGGGAYWSWPADCGDTAQADYDGVALDTQ